MSTRWIFVKVLLLILPPQSLSDSITTTCEIPSVESGDNATLTIHFGQDLTNEEFRYFSVTHFAHNAAASQTRLLDCEFSYGNVTCKETSCCTWESHVTDVFRVYIHNVSQELEGRFWGFVWPADKTEQETCNFTLKATTCLRDSINATNGQVNCSSQPVTIGQTCTVTCSAGHYFQENQSSVTYTCAGKNQWSPDITHTSCEAPTCSIDYINKTNSHIMCSAIPVSVGGKCNLTCNNGYLMQDNQTSIEYYCREKNKWSPENSANSCHEQTVNRKTDTIIIITSPVIVAVIIVIIIVFLFLKRLRERKKNKNKKVKTDVEQHLLTDSNTAKKSTNDKGQPSMDTAESYWRECIKKWYPEFHSRTYFLPSLDFNHELSSTKNVAYKQVRVPQEPQSYRNNISSSHIPPPLTDNEMRDDRALQRVLRGMQELADNGQEKEVMFVFSQLQFGNYLGESTFAPAAALLPHPNTLPEEFRKQHFDKGDFDVLIIHSEHGLFTLQISSVGENFSQQTMTDQEEDALIKKVEEVTNQLNKAEVVLKHLTSDLKPEINITKCLVMPNITSGQLKRAIERSPSTGQSLYQCLDVQTVDCVTKLCLLSDQLSDKQTLSDVNRSSLQGLRKWWQNVVRDHASQPSMSFSLYEQLVARFYGPATTVEVRSVTTPRLNKTTVGDVVSETKESVTRIVLFPKQVDILNRSPSRTFLTGPPGTGKTIVLIMQGLTWIHRGYEVHVVSTWDASRAVTFVIEHQLKETAKTPKARSRVKRHQFDLKKDGEVETAVTCLQSLSKGRQVCVIADEAVDDNNSRQSFTQFCDKLIKEVSGVCIWGASVHHGVRPLCLEEFKLTTPLRSPLVVVREVMKSNEIKNKAIHDYTVSDAPVTTDDPPVRRIIHQYQTGQHNSGHKGVWPLDCITCGHEVAHVLKELNIGRTDVHQPLKYRDVLVLCVNYPTGDGVDNNDQVITKAGGLVQGLRDYTLPVDVVEKGDEAAIRDTALGKNDRVTVACWRDVHGLERKVVVVESGVRSDVSNRLCSISRCTSQLVVIDR